MKILVKCFSFDIEVDWVSGIVNRVDTNCQPKWVLNWPSNLCYHKIMTCSWGNDYSPWAIEFYFFNFFRRYYLPLHQTSSLSVIPVGFRQGVGWMEWHVEAWILFQKHDNIGCPLGWWKSSLLSVEDFLCVRECNVVLSFQIEKFQRFDYWFWSTIR